MIVHDTAGRVDTSLAALGSHFGQLRALVTAAHEELPDPERVVRFARPAVHGDHGSLTLIRGRQRPATIAPSGDVPHQVDTLQYRIGEGPCLSAALAEDVAHAGDLRAGERWPDFSRACVELTPVRSMLSLRLVLSDGNRASMNFYADRPHAFDETDVAVAAIFAPFAALALQSYLYETQAAQLHTALLSSRQIGTAVGILMARRLITSEQAFRELVRASQHLNRKLRDIAAEVEETGTLPEYERHGRGRYGGSGRA